MIAALCIACFVLGFAANATLRAFWTHIDRERTAKRTKRGGIHYPQTPPSGRVVPVKASDPVVSRAPVRAETSDPEAGKPRLSFRPDPAASSEFTRKRLNFLAPVEPVDPEG